MLTAIPNYDLKNTFALMKGNEPSMLKKNSIRFLQSVISIIADFSIKFQMFPPFQYFKCKHFL
jgi:hypothetical protein